MKKVTLLSLLALPLVPFAQPLLSENFTSLSTNTDLNGQNGWTNNISGIGGGGTCSGSGCNNIKVQNKSMSYYFWDSAVKSIQVSPNRDAVGKGFTATSSGSVYLAILVNFSSSLQINNEIVRLLASGNTFSAGKIYIQDVQSVGFYVGISKSTSPVVYNTNPKIVSYDEDHLLVLKYTFKPMPGDDEVRLYIDPDISQSELFNKPEVSTSFGTDVGPIDRLQFHYISSARPTGYIGGVKVLNKWFVTPQCVLSGTYTVGPNGSFPTLSRAIDTLKSKGLGGNVIFELQDNYTSTHEVFPITFPQQNSCNANGLTVIIRPSIHARNLSISGGSPWSIIVLDSANYVRIDGKPGGVVDSNELSIVNNWYGNVIKFISSSNNAISNINILGKNLPVDEGLLTFFGSRNIGCDNNKISFCDFSGNVPTDLPKNLIYSKAIANVVNKNNSLLYNNFHDYGEYAVKLERENTNWKITGNSIFGNLNTSAVSQAGGFWVGNMDHSPLNIVDSNYFGGSGPRCTGNAMKIKYDQYFSFVRAEGDMEVKNNQFHRIDAYSTTGQLYRYFSCIHGALNSLLTKFIVTENYFGSPDTLDDISLCDSNTLQNTTANYLSAIYSEKGAIARDNYFNRLTAYGPMPITVGAIRSASLQAFDNKVGNLAAKNGIRNFTSGSIIGIGADYLNAKGNRVTQLTSISNNNAAVVLGIFSGLVDSVYNNEVSQIYSNGEATITGIVVGGGGAEKNIVENNRVWGIHNLATSGTPGVTGIYGGSGVMIYRNFVHSLNMNIPGVINGIRGGFKVENNMIRLGIDSNGSSITTGIMFQGILSRGQILHNSVYIGGVNAIPVYGSVCLVGPIFNCYNNVFMMARSYTTPGIAKNYAIRLDDSWTPSNGNLFYVAGEDNFIGLCNSISYKTLPQWQSAPNNVGPMDTLSFIGNPNFINATGDRSNVNLHLQNTTLAEGRGTVPPYAYLPIPEKDIDGELRSSLTPIDIGADAGNFIQQPLSVKLISLMAKPIGLDVKLTWTVAKEENQAYYQLEKSSDVSQFIFVAKEIAKYNGLSTGVYSYTDKDAFSMSGNKTIYYRLKMVSNDGLVSYSQTISLKQNSTVADFEATVSPNPFRDRINISIKQLDKHKLSVVLINSQGAQVYKRQIETFEGSGIFVLDLAGKLKSGIYTIIISNNKKTLSNSIIKIE